MAKPRNEDEDNDRYYDADASTVDEYRWGASYREGKSVEDLKRTAEEQRRKEDQAARK